MRAILLAFAPLCARCTRGGAFYGTGIASGDIFARTQFALFRPFWDMSLRGLCCEALLFD